MSESPPGPDGLPLLGNTLQFARDPFGFLEACRDYGDVVGTEVAGTGTYTLTHPDLIEHVLRDHPERYRKGEFQRAQFDSIVRDGLIVVEGEQWERQREVIQPAFHGGRMREYAPTMVAAAEEAATWDDGAVVDVHAEMTAVTLRILVNTLLDAEVDDRVADAMEVITEHFRADGFSQYVPESIPTPHNRRFRAGVAALHDLASEQMATRREERPEGGADAPADLDEDADLLDRLLAAARDPGSGVDDDAVADNLVTMLLAGHETTAIALTFVWYLLATNPEARERLDAELAAELDGDRPGLGDVSDLTYARAVVDEAMRLYPPVNFMLREAAQPDELGGYRVPEGTQVVLPQWTVHRDPRWFDDPETFRPERWLEDADRPDFAYFPFGGGPRRCVGARFATIEAVLVLATVAQDVRFEPTGSTELDLVASLTTRPKDGVDLRVRRR